MHPMMISLSELAPPSGCLTIVVIQHSAQPLAAPDRFRFIRVKFVLHNEAVSEAVHARAHLWSSAFLTMLPFQEDSIFGQYARRSNARSRDSGVGMRIAEKPLLC